MHIWKKLLASPLCGDLASGVMELVTRLNNSGFDLYLHGGTVDLLLGVPGLGFYNPHIHDLDLILFEHHVQDGYVRDPHGCQALMPAFSFVALKNFDTGSIFGYQAKGVWGDTGVEYSMTFYTQMPPTVMYDDVAHSRMLRISDGTVSGKYPDPGLVSFLATYRLVFMPDTVVVHNQFTRAVMREAQGNGVLGPAMDRRLYSAGQHYLQPEGHFLLISDIQKCFRAHFLPVDTEAYLKLYFFAFTRFRRHAGIAPGVSAQLDMLWGVIRHTLQMEKKLEFPTPELLASYLRLPLEGGMGAYTAILCLCDGFACCDTDTGRSDIARDLEKTLREVLHFPGALPLSREGVHLSVLLAWTRRHTSGPGFFENVVTPLIAVLPMDQCADFVSDRILDGQIYGKVADQYLRNVSIGEAYRSKSRDVRPLSRPKSVRHNLDAEKMPMTLRSSDIDAPSRMKTGLAVSDSDVLPMVTLGSSDTIEIRSSVETTGPVDEAVGFRKEDIPDTTRVALVDPLAAAEKLVGKLPVDDWPKAQRMLNRLHRLLEAVPMIPPPLARAMAVFLCDNLHREPKPECFERLIDMLRVPFLHQLSVRIQPRHFDAVTTPPVLIWVVARGLDVHRTHVLRGLVQMLASDMSLEPRSLRDIHGYIRQTFADPSWIDATPSDTLWDLGKAFYGQKPSFMNGLYDTLIQKGMTSQRKEALLLEWVAMPKSRLTPLDFLQALQRLMTTQPLSSATMDMAWPCLQGVPDKSTLQPIVENVCLHRLRQHPGLWLTVFFIANGLDQVPELDRYLLENRQVYKGALPGVTDTLRFLNRFLGHMDSWGYPAVQAWCVEVVTSVSEGDRATFVEGLVSALVQPAGAAVRLFLDLSALPIEVNQSRDLVVAAASYADSSLPAAISERLVGALIDADLPHDSVLSTVAKLTMSTVNQWSDKWVSRLVNYVMGGPSDATSWVSHMTAIVTHHKQGLRLLSASQVMDVMVASQRLDPEPVFRERLMQLIDQQPFHHVWSVILHLSEGSPELLPLLPVVEKTAFRRKLFAQIAQMMTADAPQTKWHLCMESALACDATLKKYLDGFFESVFHHTPNLQTPFVGQPRLTEHWQTYKSAQMEAERLRMATVQKANSQKKEADFLKLKEVFQLHFRSLFVVLARYLNNPQNRRFPAAEVAQVLTGFDAVQDKTVQARLLKTPFGWGPDAEYISSIPFFSQDQAFLVRLSEGFGVSVMSLLQKNPSLVTFCIENNNAAFLDYLLNQGLDPNWVFSSATQGALTIFELGIQFHAEACLLRLLATKTLMVEGPMYRHSPLIYLALNGDNALFEQVVGHSSVCQGQNAQRGRMEDLFAFVSGSPAILQSGEASVGIFARLDQLVAENLLDVSLPTPKWGGTLYPLDLALNLEQQKVQRWHADNSLSAFLLRHGAAQVHPDILLSLISVYSEALGMPQPDMRFVDHVGVLIKQHVPVVSPANISRVLSQALSKHDEECVLRLVQALHHFWGDSLRSPEFRFLRQVVKTYPRFMSPLDYLISEGYELEAGQIYARHVCHDALKYAPIAIFQRLHESCNMALDRLLEMGYYESGKRVLLNLAECLEVLSPLPAGRFRGVFSVAMPVLRFRGAVIDADAKKAYLASKGIVVRSDNHVAIRELQQSQTFTVLDG